MVHTLEVQRAIGKARELISDFQRTRYSVDIIRLAARVGVASVEPTEMAADGYLGRRHDGALVIRYRAGNGMLRNRFTIAHEIAHLLLAQAQGKDIARSNAGYGRDGQEETAVNRIAAELLMPVPCLTRELEDCERAGVVPGWRTINVLCRRYEVSTTAMAFRILELPDSIAVSFRINIDGCGSKLPFDRSEQTPVRLVNGIEFEMERLWREARKGTRHVIPVRSNGDTHELSCEGLVKSMKTRLGLVRQYWVIGWKMMAGGD